MQPDERHQRAPRPSEAVESARDLELKRRAELRASFEDLHFAEQRQAARDLEELGLEPPPDAPLGATPIWIRDFSVMGTAAGISLALFCAQQIPSLVTVDLLYFLLGLPMLLGALGAAAGAAAGLTLTSLRRKTSAAVGLLIATLAANSAASMLATALPDALSPLSAPFLGRAGPLVLAVTALIPLAAVVRARGSSTLLWMWSGGLLAGLMIALSHL